MNIEGYIVALDHAVRRGDATEHTHRPALKALLESFAPKIEATNEPQRIAGNAPDFIVRRGPAPIGHVEAKDIGEPLDKLLKSAQLKRYREALPNLLLTDYLEFLWIENGELKLRARIGHESGKGVVVTDDAQAQWEKISSAFFNSVAPTIKSPAQLAKALAGQTHLLRDLALDVLEAGDADLQAQFKAFEQTLVPQLSASEFADMYAQTVAYGLFTARAFDRTSGDFSLAQAETLIPTSNPFLRRFFRHIGGPDLSPGLRWMIDGIVQLLLHADMDAVIHKQQRKAGFEDPVFHFYETFLAEYDPKLRESRGVYYTPRPVVDFIVRGVDHLLKTQFERPDGLADPRTLILDPACGTATFLREVIERIYRHQHDAGLIGAWPDYVREKLLPRVFGFELMMAPYTVAHLKLALELADRGFTFRDKERLHVYLTNTLDRVKQKTDQFFERWLAEESAGAESVKNEKPVQVVIGNPPYFGESKNKSDWIIELMELYKREPDGTRLRERSKGNLNADEIKFIRFAHWRIVQTGHGVVGFIAPHTWLDGPIFRGMRAALSRDFDYIYVLDLHGNSNKREITPESDAKYGEDKNVFDILQGVAILFLVRKVGDHLRKARVRHADLWGRRDSKYQRLEETNLDAVAWRELEPMLPFFPFVPINRDAWSGYEHGWSVTKIFPLNGAGFMTKCDELNIHWTRDQAWEVVRWFSQASEGEARKRFSLPKPKVRDWKFDWAQKDVKTPDAAKRLGPHLELVRPILYRPFDIRYTYYSGQSRGIMGWPVTKIMRHVYSPDGIAMLTTRQTKGENFAHAMVSANPAEKISLSSKTSNNAFVFPLWLEPDAGKAGGEPGKQHDAFAANIRRPNLDPKFLAELARALGVPTHEPFGLPQGVAPEDVFDYVYAVLHAPTYRSRYAEFLKSDFPRIPLPPDATTFRALAALGAQLVDLHLLRQPEMLDARAPSFPASGDNLVEKPRYEPSKDGASGRVWINARQYFSGIDAQTWAFIIGGYQVLEKWLKDRKGRALAYDDITHYRRVAAALACTRTLMTEVDIAAKSLFPSSIDGNAAE